MRAWRLGSAESCVLAIIVTTQTVLFFRAYGLDTLFGSELPWHVDHLYHLYQSYVSAELWKQGSLTGFDPRFAAGHLGGVTLNWSAKAPAAFVWLTRGTLPLVFVYKLYITVAVISGPLLAGLAVRSMGGGWKELLVAGFAGILLWWGSYLSWYITVGMVSYVWAAYLAILFAALFMRTATAVSYKRAVSLALFSALAWWLHPHFPLLVAFFVIPLLACHFKGINLRWTFILGATVSASALAANAPWLVSMTQAGLGTEDTLVAFGGYQRDVAPTRVFLEAIGWLGDGAVGAKINPILLGLTVVAIITTQGDTRRVSVALAWGWLGAQFFAYGGSVLESIAQIQPNRLAPASYLMLVPCATWGLLAIISKLRNALHSKPGSRIKTIGATCVIVVILAFYPAREVIRETTAGDHGRYGMPPPHFRPSTPLLDWMVEIVKAEHSSGRRVLVEQSAGRVYDNAHISGLLALRTEVEYIGGPYASNDLINFKDGRLIGHAIEILSDHELQSLLNQYAIDLIFVHSAPSRARLNALPDVTLVGQMGPAVAFKRSSSEGMFMRGTGRVDYSRPGSVGFSGLEGSDVVVKYRFLESLRTIPESRIEPYYIDGAHPFVRFVSPPAQLELTSRPK